MRGVTAFTRIYVHRCGGGRPAVEVDTGGAAGLGVGRGGSAQGRGQPPGGHRGAATREALAGFWLIPVGWLAVSAGSNQNYQVLGIFPFPRVLAAQGVGQHPPTSQPFPFPLAEGRWSWGTWAVWSKIRGGGASRATLLLGGQLGWKADPQAMPQAGLAVDEVRFCLVLKFTHEDRVRVAAGMKETNPSCWALGTGHQAVGIRTGHQHWLCGLQVGWIHPAQLHGGSAPPSPAVLRLSGCRRLQTPPSGRASSWGPQLAASSAPRLLFDLERGCRWESKAGAGKDKNKNPQENSR